MGAVTQFDISTALRAVAAVLAVGAAFAALSCGDASSDGSSTAARSGGASPTNIITERDIKRAPKEGPTRPLLQFFQAVQYQDVAAAQSEVTKSALPSLGKAKLRAAITAVASSLGRPQISSIRRKGSRATVRALILGYEPGKTKPSTTTPASFQFRRVNRKWLLADLSYLTNASDSITESQRKQKAR